jgi:hypothetical protein
MGGQIWEGDNYGKRCGLEAGDIVVLNGNHWPIAGRAGLEARPV